MAKKRNIFGFSIPELAIFMVILSTSMAGIVSMLPSQKIGQDIDITNNNMNKIETAILTFYHKNGFLPCPASRTLASDNVAYGVSTDCSANANGVTDITPNSKSIRIGVVPTRTLNLPDDVALDAWGSKISYAIVKELGIDLESFTTSNASSEDPFIINNSEGVKLNDFPTTLYTTHVLISHGKNKKGAYTNSGAMASICGNSGQDYENCNNNNTFVKGTLNKDLGSYYDDFLGGTQTLI